MLVELLDALVLAVVEARRLVEVGLGVAAAFFEACERCGGCGGGLLELFALARGVRRAGAGVRRALASRVARSFSKAAASCWRRAMRSAFWLRASRLRSLVSAQSCRRRSMRATSDSIWRRAAPELADSRSASRRSWVLPSMVALSSAI